tara:strand:- start:945 stop:1541 length:597 start_codon:yes stop_codon:yes gene_type:complete
MIIGLTGGIGSGKSSAANFFSAHNVLVLEADELAKEAITKGTDGFMQVVDCFGESILNESGEIDRDLMRERIFSDHTMKSKLESIIHPLVGNKILEKIAESIALYTVVEVPLIFETNSMNNYDRILVIDCYKSLQLERSTRRDKNSQELIQKIIDSQCTREERLSIANDVIANNGSLEELKHKIKETHYFYTELIKHD